MRAMLLCAGAGSRLRPRTHVLPKPLASAGGVPLAVRQIRALARAGVRDIVVNAAHGAAELVHALGGGERWNVRLRYSIEGKSALEALETRGGIVRALDLLTDEGREDALIAVAGDIVTCSGRIPKTRSRPASDGTASGRRRRSPFASKCVPSPETRPRTRFIGGEPMKPAANIVAGSS